jgi:glycosyltransferase involved in cell wall biosynthesis
MQTVGSRDQRSGTPLVSMVMIARDEQANVVPCFETFWDHVGEVVLVDTGSRDSTVEAAEQFARARGEASKLVVGHFKWCDDFAAARNHADELASGAWVGSVDLDDRVRGAAHLSGVARRAGSQTMAFSSPYHYTPPFGLLDDRPRLIRRGAGHWTGRVHEELRIRSGRPPEPLPGAIEWRHARAEWTSHDDLYLRIARRWLEEDPDHPLIWKALLMIGEEEFRSRRFTEAAVLLRRFLEVFPHRPSDADRILVSARSKLDACAFMGRT